jgi:hypothetical protein
VREREADIVERRHVRGHRCRTSSSSSGNRAGGLRSPHRD